MSQSNKIFGVIVALFIVLITVKGQLPAYYSVFFGTKATT